VRAFNCSTQEGTADACVEGFFDDVLPGLVGIGGVALDDALDELVRGLFAQAFLDAASGDGFEPLAEVFFEGGLPQQGLHALGAACGGEEVGGSLEKLDGIELSLGDGSKSLILYLRQRLPVEVLEKTQAVWSQTVFAKPDISVHPFHAKIIPIVEHCEISLPLFEGSRDHLINDRLPFIHLVGCEPYPGFESRRKIEPDFLFFAVLIIELSDGENAMLPGASPAPIGSLRQRASDKGSHAAMSQVIQNLVLIK
jgi:hypothetical protein